MSNNVKILDGMVTLFQRTNMKTLTWTAFYRLPDCKGRICKSTGTRDLDKAKQVATNAFYDMVAAQRRGYEPAPKLFGKIARDYLDVMQEEANCGARSQRTVDDFRPALERYLIPYFGNRPIDTINDKDVRDYLQWRKTYWTEGPGKDEPYRVFKTAKGTTVKMRRPQKEVTLRTGELGGLRRIFRHAVSKGWLDNAHMPSIRLPKPGKDIRKEKRRPAFVPEEWDKVVHNMALYAKATEHPEVRYDRQMLVYYMLIMANTGMRPTDEHCLVRWKHVQEFERGGQHYCRVWIGDEGKTGSRKIICHHNVYKWFMKIREFSPWTSDEDYVFANRKTGKQIKSFLKGMRSFLGQIGMEHNREGKLFSPYSLRATYATHRLINGADPYIIAKNMGHKDLKMLYVHYGQDDPEYRPYELTKEYEDPRTAAAKAIIEQQAPGLIRQVDSSDIEQYALEKGEIDGFVTNPPDDL